MTNVKNRKVQEKTNECIELNLSSYKKLLSKKNRLKQFLQFSTGSISVRVESRLVKFLDAFHVN